MQIKWGDYENDYTHGYGQDAATGIVSALLTILGAAAVAIMILRAAFNLSVSWSPTITARTCFYFPDEHTLPDGEELTQLLLSASFFGTDALYFDKGDENTGMSEVDIGRNYEETNPLSPSGNGTAQQPEIPLDSQHSQETSPLKKDIYAFDSSKIPKDELALIPYDLSLGAKNGEILISNTTGYSIEPKEYLKRPYPINTDLSEYNGDDPLVLIVHTHGTEAYSPDGAVSVSPSLVMRSSDTGENVVAVGATMAEILNDAHIPTLHIEVMHDLESYQHSYDLTADTIQRCLKKYPSIKYVFDIHRDAIYTSEGDFIRPVTEINGEICAQIMLVVGTNERGADHPEWETNFTVASHLQSRLTESYTGFARPINIRGASFNEQFTPGSLLIEIGSAANSLQEAQNSARYLTYTIIDMIKENQN